MQTMNYGELLVRSRMASQPRARHSILELQGRARKSGRILVLGELEDT